MQISPRTAGFIKHVGATVAGTDLRGAANFIGALAGAYVGFKAARGKTTGFWGFMKGSLGAVGGAVVGLAAGFGITWTVDKFHKPAAPLVPPDFVSHFADHGSF